MALPPGFAPQVKLKGTEEIRFAPGMFEPASRTYFTCALALVVDGTTELGAAELRDFLEKYYRGLSAGRASRSGVTPNPAQTQAEVQAVEGAKNRFTAQVGFFDTFSDGRRILLHVEAAVLPAAARKQTTVILLVSPSAKESGVWPALREIGRKGEKNVPSEP